MKKKKKYLPASSIVILIHSLNSMHEYIRANQIEKIDFISASSHWAIDRDAEYNLNKTK